MNFAMAVRKGKTTATLEIAGWNIWERCPVSVYLQKTVIQGEHAFIGEHESVGGGGADDVTGFGIYQVTDVLLRSHEGVIDRAHLAIHGVTSEADSIGGRDYVSRASVSTQIISHIGP